MNRVVKVGTRRSDLALAQTNFIIGELKKLDSRFDYEIVEIVTKGDKILDKPLLEFGGKGVFIDEFERGLLLGEIDLAVHSAKDMPMEIPEGLGILGVPKREDPRDVMVSINDLAKAKDFVIGTGSLRRKLQVEKLVNGKCENIRGNVPTRLNSIKGEKFKAVVLAKAGLNRLNLDNLEGLHYHCFSTDEFVPAGGQGILAVEGRIDDEIAEVVKKIDDINTRICLETERNILKTLNASCNEAVGAYAKIDNDNIYVTAIYEINEELVKIHEIGEVDNYKNISIKVAEGLLNYE